jgi:spore germination protein KB
MRKTTKDLNTHQLMYILFLTSMIYSIIFIPNRIISLTGRDMWITIVFFVLLNIFHVVIFYICIKLAPNLTLNEILEKTLGKVISKIILAGFGIYLFIRLAIMLSDFGLYTNDVVFSNNWQPVVLPVIIVGGFCAYSGLRSSSRMIEVLGAGIIIVMIITIFAVIASSDLTNILPILNSGFKPVLNGFSNYLFYAFWAVLK